MFKCLCFKTFFVFCSLSLKLSCLIQEFLVFAVYLSLQRLDLSLQLRVAPFRIICLFLILTLIIIHLRPHLCQFLLQHQLYLRCPLQHFLSLLITTHNLILQLPNNTIQVLNLNLFQLQLQLVLVISIEVLLLD